MQKNRFNYDAASNEEATDYMLCRAKQLLKHDYKLLSIDEYEWGISAYFNRDNRTYQSLYITEPYRGKGIFPKQVTHTILSSVECEIEPYLKAKNIAYQLEKLTPFPEYLSIEDYYGSQKAERSGVYLMNHIDEGLYILDKLNASEIAKKAYCLHPIAQSDEALLENYAVFKDIDNQVIIALIEYRSVANAYLSKREIQSIDEIKLSPLKDVNDMLIADKIQNKKDFELYHKGSHPRSMELDHYFNNWLKRLNISDAFYAETMKFMT